MKELAKQSLLFLVSLSAIALGLIIGTESVFFLGHFLETHLK